MTTYTPSTHTYEDPFLTPTTRTPVYGGGTGGGSGTITAYPTTTTSLMAMLTRTTVNKEYEVYKIVDKGYWIKATGSRVTKDGWTEESDWDYVIFDPDMKLEPELMKDGWELGGSGVVEVESFRCFSSLKKGNLNFILVNKEEDWKKWVIATNLLKMMNPKTKEERIKLFDTVFGKTPDSKATDFGDPF